MLAALLITTVLRGVKPEVTTEEVQFLNELPLEKLLKLKNSLREIDTTEPEDATAPTPGYLESFGAEAMALKAPLRKTGYEEVWHKGDNSKISNAFSMSVTTLAFLAFGGYLLCLIVQAVKAKQAYVPTATVTPATIFVSNIRKRPHSQVHSQVASYGRRRRALAGARGARAALQLHLPPEELFKALLHVCEGYARWSGSGPRGDA